VKKISAILLLTLLALTIVPSVLAWTIERPSYDIRVGERVGTANSDGKASVGLGISIDEYDEGHGDYGGHDYINMNVSMTANSRKGIMYRCAWESLWWINENELAYKIVRNAVGDEWGDWVDIPEFYAFRFYGGPGSAQYTKAWITSNGFICFDPNNLTTPNPSSFPSTTKPNAVIAAVWSDLDVDSDSSIITGLYEFVSRKYFVVTWKNVRHKASNQRLTFQIILRDQTWYAQSHIWISYQSVSAINTEFAVGVEDHEGYKGNGGRHNGDTLADFNGQTLHYDQISNMFFLKELKITLIDENTNTRLRIQKDGNYIRGYNVKLRSTEFPEPDSTYMFLTALAGGVTLLLGGSGGIILVGCTVVDSFLVYMDWVETLAYYQYSHVDELELRDQWSDPPFSQGAYIIVPTEFECVDAALDIVVHWVFDDPNDAAHSLTITANATYAEYDTSGMYIQVSSVPTSVNLNVVPDAGNDRSSARVVASTPIEYRAFLGINLPDPGFDDPDDYYKINVPEDYLIVIDMIPAENANFDLYLYYKNNQQPVASSTNPNNGAPELISYEGFSGYYYIRVKCELSFGFYDLHINLLYHPIGPPPPGPLSTNTTVPET